MIFPKFWDLAEIVPLGVVSASTAQAGRQWARELPVSAPSVVSAIAESECTWQYCWDKFWPARLSWEQERELNSARARLSNPGLFGVDSEDAVAALRSAYPVQPTTHPNCIVPRETSFSVRRELAPLACWSLSDGQSRLLSSYSVADRRSGARLPDRENFEIWNLGSWTLAACQPSS